jgi:hypothetical protein
MLAGIIRIIHILIRIFLLLTPFFGGEYLLSLHFLIVPFVMLHWVTNQTVCALTELEKLARGGCASGDTFFGQVFEPIYRNESFVGTVISPFYTIEDKETETLAVWVGLTGLWLITLCKLWPTGFAYLHRELDHALALLSRPPRTPPP